MLASYRSQGDNPVGKLLWSHFVEPQPSVSSSPILQTKNPRPVSEGFMFGRTRRMVFNRHCLWRLNPSGTFALLRWTKRSYGRVCRTERFSPKPNPPKPKNPPKGGFLILVGPGGLFRARLPRALSPLRGATASLWRPKCSFGRILSNRSRRSRPARFYKQKTPARWARVSCLVGPGGFEPPTSTMSR